jgi:uncharacterized damage-inducible protein DinB
MAAPITWSTRSFSFDFPVDVYPSILMRLRGTPARMEELLGAADDARLRQRPAEGKWSALERCGHLVEVEALWHTRIGEYLAGADTLSPADMHNRSTFEADFNSQPADAVLAAFREARESLLELLDSLAPADFARVATHPRLKVPMRLVDGLYFSAEHDDHELAWVWELLRGGAAGVDK